MAKPPGPAAQDEVGASFKLPIVKVYLPSTPQKGVIGMGTMTMMLALGAFFVAYLYYSRQPSDG